MFTGSTTSGPIPQEERPEVTKVGVAKLLFVFTGLYERWRNEMQEAYEKLSALLETRRHRPLDPGPQHEPDFEERIREAEGSYTNWGNDNRGLPPKGRRDQLAETISSIIQKLLILAIGFVFGALWNHETRISHLEGERRQETSSARGP